MAVVSDLGKFNHQTYDKLDRALGCISWGMLVCLIDITVNNFDLLNDVIGCFVVCLGFSALRKFTALKAIEWHLKWLHWIALISLLESLMAHFPSDDVLSFFGTWIMNPLQLWGLILFLTSMRKMCHILNLDLLRIGSQGDSNDEWASVFRWLLVFLFIPLLVFLPPLLILALIYTNYHVNWHPIAFVLVGAAFVSLLRVLICLHHTRKALRQREGRIWCQELPPLTPIWASKKSRSRAIIASAIVIVIGALAWFFCSYSPSQFIQKHDVKRFVENHDIVNMGSGSSWSSSSLGSFSRKTISFHSEEDFLKFSKSLKNYCLGIQAELKNEGAQVMLVEETKESFLIMYEKPAGGNGKVSVELKKFEENGKKRYKLIYLAEEK